MKFMGKRYELIKDPKIVRYVNQIGKKILDGMPPQPFNYRFYIVKEDVYNAFAIPAGHIFIHSGLLAAMESEDELAGIAKEIGAKGIKSIAVCSVFSPVNDEMERKAVEIMAKVLTCGNCMLICWPDKEDRKENYRLLTTSGRVIRGKDGPVAENIPAAEIPKEGA